MCIRHRYMNKMTTSSWASLLAACCLGSGGLTAENTLTPAEIAEGWILLFDGETSFGWAARGEAQWIVADGELTTRPGSGAGMLATTTEFADFELKADFWIDATANSGVFLRAPTRGDITALNAYEVNIYDAHATWPTGSINEVGRAQSCLEEHRAMEYVSADGARAGTGGSLEWIDGPRGEGFQTGARSDRAATV